MKNNISVVTWLATNLFAYKEPNPIEIALIKQAQEIEKQQQDEFAIGFTNWCEDYYYPSSAKDIWYDKPDFSNAKKFTTKELLEIFKNK
jgi:hypothetical protein